MTTLRRFKRFRMLYCSCNDVTIQRHWQIQTGPPPGNP